MRVDEIGRHKRAEVRLQQGRYGMRSVCIRRVCAASTARARLDAVLGRQHPRAHHLPPAPGSVQARDAMRFKREETIAKFDKEVEELQEKLAYKP